ncbi:MAG: ComF family protein [Acidobacteriota bacterium]|nr:ComF family protein [Acidobacteriota bacterium]
MSDAGYRWHRGARCHVGVATALVAAGRHPSLLGARAVGPYAGSLRRLVHVLKYERRATLASPLGKLMRQHGDDVLQDINCVVPVPLHRRQRRARGFNQAAALAEHLGPPVVHALHRTKATRPQTELPAARRHGNVLDAFAPTRNWAARRSTRQSSRAEGPTVVIIDDVATTGATLDACARVLRRCGAGEVRALTLARAVRPATP